VILTVFDQLNFPMLKIIVFDQLPPVLDWKFYCWLVTPHFGFFSILVMTCLYINLFICIWILLHPSWRNRWFYFCWKLLWLYQIFIFQCIYGNYLSKFRKIHIHFILWNGRAPWAHKTLLCAHVMHLMYKSS